jgi:hypothetical protein
MKKFTALFFLFSAFAFPQGTWTQMSNFPGAARTGAVGFDINGKGYMGTGQDAIGNMLNDFWEYDPIADSWTAKANFGGAARQYAVGFSINTKGYIGTGIGLADFWEYNPATNTWTAKANYAGGGMTASSGFAIPATGKGYLGGCGLDALSNFTKKFYEYDQATNTWTAKTQPSFNVSSLPYMRMQGVGFAIGAKGYLLSGMGTMASYVKDLYEYDPSTNAWTARASYTAGFGVYNATGFGLLGKGYMVTGEDDAGNTANYLREYSPPATNTWGLAAPFPGTGRQACASFTVNGCGYVLTGRDATGALKQVWRWCPPAVLPIELESFTGKNYGEKNNLRWKTATETNNSYFTLERSYDAVNFEVAATLKGAGNSNTSRSYNFNDLGFNTDNKVVYYRLKQTDLSNKMSVHGIVAVQLSNPDHKPQINFNNNENSITVFYDFEKGGDFVIDIYDLLGRTIYSEQIYAGENSESINSASIPFLTNGLYIVKFSDVQGTIVSQTKFQK